MEQTRFCIRPVLEVQDYVNLSRLHEKVGNGAVSKVNRISNIILAVMAVVMPLDAIVLIILQRGISSTSILALAVGAVAIGYLCLRRKIFARVAKNQNEKLAGNMEIVVDAEGLHAKNASVDATYALDAIESVYCWRNCYFLYLDKQRLQILPFRDFTEGDPASFGAFISEKTGLPVQAFTDQLKKER